MDTPPKKILLTTSGSSDSALTARRAVELAGAFGSELHVLHVVPVSQPYHIVGETLEGASMYEEDMQRAKSFSMSR